MVGFLLTPWGLAEQRNRICRFGDQRFILAQLRGNGTVESRPYVPS